MHFSIETTHLLWACLLAHITFTLPAKRSILDLFKSTSNSTPRNRTSYDTFDLHIPGMRSATGTPIEIRCNDVNGCLDFCTRDPHCTAVEFDSERQLCSIFQNQVQFKNMSSETGVDHYHRRIKPHRACVRGIAAVYNGMAGSGGTIIKATYNSSDQCHTTCISARHCIAFDYNKKRSACSIYYRPHGNASSDELTANAETIHVHLKRCPHRHKACTMTYFKRISSMKKELSHPQDGNFTLVEQCKLSCRFDTDCMAIEYVLPRNACYVHTNASRNELLVPEPLTNYYDLRRCETPKEPCLLDYFEMWPNMYTRGMEKQSERFTLEQCRQACLYNEHCEAIDYECRGKYCWLKLDNKTQELMPHMRIDHHVLERCQFIELGCVNNSLITWYKMQASGGTFLQDIHSLSDCKRICLQSSACIAVDYAQWMSHCWVHHVTTNLFIQPNRLVNHYRVHRCNRTTEHLTSDHDKSTSYP